jgi:hypothetical protein
MKRHSDLWTGKHYTVRNAHGIFIICGNFTHVIGGCLPSLEGCNVNHDPDGKFTIAII